jgi:hypothetical protein
MDIDAAVPAYGDPSASGRVSGTSYEQQKDFSVGATVLREGQVLRGASFEMTGLCDTFALLVSTQGTIRKFLSG